MKKLLYQRAANAVALLHVAFIVFVVLGGIAVLRWPKLAWIHLPAALWGAAIELAGWYCPLTAMENRLLRKAGLAGYDGGFISHYVFAVVYPDGLTRGVEIALGILVLAINAAVYTRVFA